MGRKSEKSKEKKQKRKEEKLKIAASYKVVKAAQEIEDPMSLLLPFKSCNKNGIDVEISFVRRADLTDEVYEWLFTLLEGNMKAHYEKSEGKWHARAKRDELSEEAACYLIAYQRNPGGAPIPVGFVHFRFDLDDDDEVLYCYEIQLESSVRGKGLGRHLMQCLELMSFKTGMKRVVLTVFRHNKQAYDFFNKLKYDNDDTCPSWQEGYIDGEHVTYEILSKSTQPKSKETKPLTSQPNGCATGCPRSCC